MQKTAMTFKLVVIGGRQPFQHKIDGAAARSGISLRVPFSGFGPPSTPSG
jgi:hypothetical protein